MKSGMPISVDLTLHNIIARLGYGSSEQDIKSDGKINIIPMNLK